MVHAHTTTDPTIDAAGITHGRVIAIANQKGGSGKTTSTIALAGAFAEADKTVLVIDCDEQGHATIGLGVQKNAAGTYTLLIDDEAQVDNAIVTTEHPGIQLIPGHIQLSEVGLALAQEVGAHAILSEHVEQLRSRFDYILIDCPPSLSLQTLNALYAADEVLVPINPGVFDLDGLAALRATVKKVRTRLHRPHLAIRHVFLTNFSPRRANDRDAYAFVQQAFAEELIDTADPVDGKPFLGSGVPTNSGVGSSQSAGQPLTHYDRRGSASLAYRRIASTIDQRSTHRG
ncbi:MAG: ParA family protein [Micromonosporaceae bacterium]|nr:ParA family protein [Micromonosporaceae bacterium]